MHIHINTYRERERELEKLNCLYKFSNASSLSPARRIDTFSYTIHTRARSDFLAPPDFAVADKCAATSWCYYKLNVYNVV